MKGKITLAKLYADAQAWGMTPFVSQAPQGKYPLKFAMVLADDPHTRQVPPQGLVHKQRGYFNAHTSF